MVNYNMNELEKGLLIVASDSYLKKIINEEDNLLSSQSLPSPSLPCIFIFIFFTSQNPIFCLFVIILVYHRKSTNYWRSFCDFT